MSRLRHQRTTFHLTTDSRRLTQAHLKIKKKIDGAELRKAINETKNTSPEHSKIDKRQVSMLPQQGLMYLLTIYNAMLSLGCFPIKSKDTALTMIHKPGQTPTEKY